MMNTILKDNVLYEADSIVGVADFPADTIHLILSDIPYGIGADDWDVLHNNTNSAYLGNSPAQQKAGAIFKKRGKPLNGWSKADKEIGKQYHDWCASWASSWFSVLVPGGNAIVFAGRRLAHQCILAMEEAGFTFKDMIGWDKYVAPLRAQHVKVIFDKRNNVLSGEQWKDWRVGNLRPVFEPILWFVKPYKIGTTLADNILSYGVGGYNSEILQKYGQECNNLFRIQANKSDNGLHPTQKPLKLMELLIELCTIENQLVLDPFCGSATSLLAAMKLKRRYIGFENNHDYYIKAKKRLEDEKANLDSDLFWNQSSDSAGEA